MKQTVNEILNHRSVENIKDFNDPNYFTERMKNYNLSLPGEKVYIKIPNARAVLENSFKYFLAKENKDFVWFPEYEEIVKWIENNEGRGLLLFGPCGLGKSMLARYVIPSILFAYYNKICTIKSALQLNLSIDEVLEKKIISIDDLGTESILNDYGNKRLPIAELLDATEQNGKLLIISTNLNGAEIKNLYGSRVLERIISTTKRIEFKGDSLRR
jgi:DNA replication protein DnaC